MAEQQEFKFPDEIEAEEAKASAKADDDGFEIQVEDDVPPADKDPVTGKLRAPLPKKVVEELDNDDLDEYSEKVKKRLGQMKKVWHDERRAKEAAAREKEEALKFAQTQMEENRRLKQRLGMGEKVFIQEVTKAATTELNVAKERLRQAYDTGDAERITEAQEALTDAKLKLKDYERFQPSVQDEETEVHSNKQERTPSPAPAQVDPKAAAWKEQNSWFGVDEEMTALALGLHEKLVRSGVDPRSDDYYNKVNQTMRKRFPDYFEDDAEQTTEKEEKPAPRTKAANVVAPVTRSSAPRQTIRLTSTQVAIAKKLGLSNEQYARELMKLEAN
jgi:hypothetical protein